MNVYLVGGAVRDKLLNLSIKDRDWVVVGSSPDEMLSKHYQQVGNDFPVFIHPTSGEEYALARTERKTGVGYGGFECYAGEDVSLEEDLSRRDLTINAMAESPSERSLTHSMASKILIKKYSGTYQKPSPKTPSVFCA